MASLPPSQNSSLQVQAQNFRAMAACPPPTILNLLQILPASTTSCSAIPSLSFSPKDLLHPRFHLPPTAKLRQHLSQMAVLSLGCGSDKENAPPPPSAARGIAVKRQTMKRPGGGSKAPHRRPPLRDITRLFVTAPAPCPPPSTAVLLALCADAALPEAVRSGADGVTVKQGSRSLRMGFR